MPLRAQNQAAPGAAPGHTEGKAGSALSALISSPGVQMHGSHPTSEACTVASGF